MLVLILQAYHANYFNLKQADEEYFSICDETICSQSFKTASVNSGLLDVKNTNEHICRLVVNILMELSEKFVEDDVESFKILAQRLSCMKNYLGGAEFLLKGFTKILTKNSINLKGKKILIDKFIVLYDF